MPELACSTADRDAWLAARRSGVTGTDIVTIMGLSHTDSPYSLYWRKLGQVPETPDNPRFALGRYLEPYVHQLWIDTEPDVASKFYTTSTLFRSSARPWQMATPDALPTDCSAVAEFKTWADADKPSWSDGPPAAVRAQTIWYMDVMDVPTGHVGVVFLPSGEFRSYVIEHQDGCPTNRIETAVDCLTCIDMALMRKAGLAFQQRLFDNDPPDPDASAATLAAVKARFTKRAGKRGAVDIDLWERWTKAKASLEHWTQGARGYESLIREQLGEADEIEVDGQLVGRRIVTTAHVKAYTRTQDYIKRTKGAGDE